MLAYYAVSFASEVMVDDGSDALFTSDIRNRETVNESVHLFQKRAHKIIYYSVA